MNFKTLYDARCMKLKMKTVFIVIVICVHSIASSSEVLNRSLRSVDDCGVPKIKTGLIVQGQSFPRGSYPWIVALMHQGFKPPRFFCGGTLISNVFVISAAHCILQKHKTKKVLPREVLALFGAHDLENNFETGRYALSPKEIFIHDKWNPGTTEYDSDISLLEFETNSVLFNDFVQPICLWKSENEPIVTEGIVTGWGKSENPDRNHENLPKLIKAPIQTNEECFLEERELVALSSRRTFCAGLKNGTGVCHGDSGGGFFFKQDEAHYLKGIVSSSLLIGSDCDVSRNAIYTNVLKFSDWIRTTTESLKEVFCSFERRKSYVLNKTAIFCVIKKQIKNKNFILGPPVDTTCTVFNIEDNKDVKYLPRQISEILPNLEEMFVEKCVLTIVRDFYFKNMQKLRFLILHDNKIVTIEPNAFKDLVSVETMWLKQNFIQTLDKNIFDSMTSLTHIYLTSNKIKFLSPSTFKIPGGKLRIVDLRDNICIHQQYNDAEQRNRIESDLRAQCSSNSKALSPQDLKNVVCSFDRPDSIYLKRRAGRCFADQKIESEDYFVLKEPIRGDVEVFKIEQNKNVKFLPKNVGEKFPNLKEFDVRNCGFTIVRNFYFKNMRNLKFLILIYNKISRIEPEALKDLISVEKLWLHDNLIDTLDENLFASMISMKEIYLATNKIKFLSPATFKITGGNLDYVDLKANVCIGKNYRSNLNLNKLESELNTTCAFEKISCSFESIASNNMDIQTHGCFINQTIDRESSVLNSPVYTNVKQFFIDGLKNVKFLPKSIGEKFPNLSELRATNSGLVIVRNYYLQNLRNLRLVRMNDNMITSIESGSFKDLVTVQKMWFHNNAIETLDKNLFIPLVRLELVVFSNNKIKFLISTTFNVPDGKLELIDLRDNICMNKIYGSKSWGHDNLNQLETDLESKCPLQ